MNVVAGDKSEGENEEEENIGQVGEGDGNVLNQVDERLIRAISKLGKDLKLMWVSF